MLRDFENYSVSKTIPNWIIHDVLNTPSNAAFITLKFPTEPKNFEHAQELARRYFAKIERLMSNNSQHWKKKPFELCLFIEQGKFNILHVHAIINLRHLDYDNFKSILKALEVNCAITVGTLDNDIKKLNYMFS